MPAASATSARSLRHRFGATSWISPLVALAIIPKCGLCVIAWLAAFAGLDIELCGAGPSWTLLATETSHRFGLTATALAVLGAPLLAIGGIIRSRRSKAVPARIN